MVKTRNYVSHSSRNYVPRRKRNRRRLLNKIGMCLHGHTPQYHILIQSSQIHRLVKSSLKHVHPNPAAKVEVEVDKLVKVGFIREVQYLIWLENMMSVKVKNDKSKSASTFGTCTKPVPKMTSQFHI